MNFAKLSSVADERHNGVKLPVLLKIFNKQEFVSMFEFLEPAVPLPSKVIVIFSETRLFYEFLC